MIAEFNRFSLLMTKAQSSDCSHSGDCDFDVAELLKNPKIIRQFKKILPEDIVAELKEYGAWDSEELCDTIQNQHRILWIAAGNISEELYAKKR
jgi:hypothetical protein